MQFCTKVVHGKSWRHRTRPVLHGVCKIERSSTEGWCGNPCPICKKKFSSTGNWCGNPSPIKILLRVIVRWVNFPQKRTLNRSSQINVQIDQYKTTSPIHFTPVTLLKYYEFRNKNIWNNVENVSIRIIYV